MNEPVVEYEIKLEKSVKIIPGVLAIGNFLNVFAPVFNVKDAFAGISESFGTRGNPFVIQFKFDNDILYPLK